MRDVFRIVFFLPHDHFDLAPGVFSCSEQAGDEPVLLQWWKRFL
ncbi:hypothetical protein D187_007822 [Cystobacter fuscus DSM 2262]|uniref:Uncharacterized protein n=1 Tax=Cystobacter fuscus (strain ATCC 25194 / DSM 2262 / NBRC 100088 / M29) TaxID=1242864 RepID=S9NW83_CYSF2|nr:hypothetical protein [Cystobacter fuscus]EPX56480.1 hypothetical protein D187_007822 [Cystobacter fuscus DSM 2262]